MQKGSCTGQFVGFGCCLVLLVIGAAVLLAKPLALSIFDTLILEHVRDKVTLSVEAPEEVQLGEVFTLTLMMDNHEQHHVHRMLYVDLTGELYDAFEPVASQPAWVDHYDVDVRRRRSVVYDVDLSPGATPYALQLRARQPGRWKGEIVYYRATTRHLAGPAVPITILVRAEEID